MKKPDLTPNAPAFTALTNLAAGRLGARAIVCTDDFFAEMENLVKPGRGIFIADKYTERGKWMDGWESRRKRTPGYDWCILELGAPGYIHGVDIDTNHFLGNHPPHASLEACLMPAGSSAEALEQAAWTEILPKSDLDPGSQHFFELKGEGPFSHARLNIFPDGGVARLKVYGEVHKDWSQVRDDEVVDLAAAVNGARALTCNDMFFSSKDNLLMPGKGVNMGDGWETKRNRTPNNVDWLILKLATPGVLDKAMLDTRHFKGNYPDTFSLHGIYQPDLEDDACTSDSLEWQLILDRQKLSADAEHEYESEISAAGPFTHVKLCIYPDGGVSRLRLWGRVAR